MLLPHSVVAMTLTKCPLQDSSQHLCSYVCIYSTILSSCNKALRTQLLATKTGHSETVKSTVAPGLLGEVGCKIPLEIIMLKNGEKKGKGVVREEDSALSVEKVSVSLM